MKFLTFSQLGNQELRKAETINARSYFSRHSNKVVFISYRRKDRARVVPIVDFLQGLGTRVYIDYLDETLPDTPTLETAEKLRNRIRKADKFILVATPNSSESKWMPWELGLGDGFNGYENAIVLPLIELSYRWEEQEYYKAYGFVNKSEDRFPDQLNRWEIKYPTGKKVELVTWLNE